MGQQWLGAEVFKALMADGHEVVSACAPAADRLALAAVDAGVPCSDPGAALHAAWVPEGIDLIVCAHAHCFVSAAARRRARLGAIGYHPSLLPRHRGRDAVRWAIHMGERITGGTVYRMSDRADAGPILLQDWCFIQAADDAVSLWRRDLGPMGIRLLRLAVSQLAAGVAIERLQDERLATWEPAFERASLARSAAFKRR